MLVSSDHNLNAIPQRLRAKIIRFVVLCVVGIAALLGWGWHDGGVVVESPAINNLLSTDTQNTWTGQRLAVSGDLFMTPRDESIERWIDAIGTPRALSGWLYQFTSRDILAYRATLRDQGTSIGLILEHSKYKQSNKDATDAVRVLSGDRVKVVRDDQLGVNFTHAKTFVTDDVAIIQTANLTHSSLTKNIEHFAVIRDPAVITSLQTVFAFDRSGKAKKAKPPAYHPNLLICPRDCKPKYLALIDQATVSIDTMQQYISDPAIEDALRRAIDRGVTVRIMLGNLPTNKAWANERSGPVSIPKTYVHSKTILIDDRFLVVGSMNMSTNSLERNREIGIVLTNREAIEDWSAGFASYRNPQEFFEK